MFIQKQDIRKTQYFHEIKTYTRIDDNIIYEFVKDSFMCDDQTINNIEKYNRMYKELENFLLEYKELLDIDFDCICYRILGNVFSIPESELDIKNMIEHLSYTNDCSYTKFYQNNIPKPIDDSVEYATIMMDTTRKSSTVYTNFDIVGDLHLSELRIFDINKKEYINNEDIAKTEIKLYMKLHRNMTLISFKFIEKTINSICFHKDASDVELIFDILDNNNNIVAEVIVSIPNGLSIFNSQESSILISNIPESLEDKFKRLYE